MKRAAGALLAAWLAGPSAGAPRERLAVRADVLHDGTGQVVADALVLVEDGVVAYAGPRAAAPAHAGARELHAAHVVPGLVASVVMPPLGDERSIEPESLAAEVLDTHADVEPWLASGVTALAVSPGQDRLVGGRGAVMRLRGAGRGTLHVRQGAVHASLLPGAFEPPLAFDPNAPVNVDNPLRPALPQRPHGSPAALAELRRLLEAARGGEGSDAFEQVLSGALPLRVHAHRVEDIRRALALAREFGARLVVDGGTEAWKAADELAAARAKVLLSVLPAGVVEPPDPERGTSAPDAAGRLAAAGVDVGLTSEDWGAVPDLLLAAGCAVRAGLGEEAALSAVTRVPADAAGASDLGRLVPGARADLVGLDDGPLQLRARLLFVVTDGEIRFQPEEPRREKLMVLRAGTIHSGANIHHDATLVVRDGIVTGVGPGTAAPAEAPVRDFGPASVVVPGFVDAFSFVGLEAGPGPGGSSRLRAATAVELGEESLRRAAAAGVTTALVVPPARGGVLGAPALVSTVARSEPPPRDADAPELTPEQERAASVEKLDVVQSDAGLAFFLDGGASDVGPRAPRVKALKELLGRAKSYSERFDKKDKKPAEGKGAAKKPKREEAGAPRRSPDRRSSARPAKKEKDAPEKDEALEPFRPLFASERKAFLVAGRQDSILEGLDAFKEVGLTPVIAGGEEADLVRAELKKRDVSVVLGPDVLRSDDGRLVNVAAELREAGVRVAFGSMEYGGAERLPLAVARAVRHGLSPEDALSALTHEAAEAVGAPESIGRLARGDRADFVVFSGDPFEPTSRVLAVVVRGEDAPLEGDAAPEASR